MSALTPEQLEKRRARDRKYFQSLTLEQVEKRRARGREYMKKKRAQLRAAKEASGSLVDASKPSPAPETAAKPQNPAESAPEKAGKLRSERAKHREYRATLAEYLEDCLTDPAAPMSGSEFERMRLASVWLGWFEKLDRLEASADGKVEMLSEMRLSIALECLRRLAEMKPAGSAPTTMEVR
jgi:hypothetical protein